MNDSAKPVTIQQKFTTPSFRSVPTPQESLGRDAVTHCNQLGASGNASPTLSARQ